MANKKKRTQRSKAEAEKLFKQYLKKLHEMIDFMFMVAYVEKEWDAFDWAERAGLCPATIINLEMYQTKRPQLRTIMCMATALGYKVEIVPLEKVRKPPARVKARLPQSRKKGKRTKTITIPTMVEIP